MSIRVRKNEKIYLIENENDNKITISIKEIDLGYDENIISFIPIFDEQNWALDKRDFRDTRIKKIFNQILHMKKMKEKNLDKFIGYYSCIFFEKLIKFFLLKNITKIIFLINMKKMVLY